MNKHVKGLLATIAFVNAAPALAQDAIKDALRSATADPTSFKISPRNATSLAAERRIGEMENLTSLTAEGRALYAADEHKRNGYDYCRLAIPLAEQGEFRRAVREASKALFLGQTHGNDDLVAHAKRDLAVAYSYAGHMDRAQAYAEEALKHAVRPHNRNPVHMWVYKVLGDAALRSGDAKQAISHYERAIRSSDGRMRFFTRVSLANAYVANNDFPKALETIKQAAAYLDVLDGDGRAGAEATLLRTRGNLALKEGKGAEAKQLFTQALERTTGTDGAYQRFWALEGQARAEMSLKDAATALKSYEQAMAVSEEVRARFRNEEISSGLFGEMQQVFDETVRLQMEAGNVEAAWTASERGRARALLDLIRNRVNASSGREVFSELLAEPAKLEDVQSLLRADEALVQFHVLPERTYVWVIRSSAVSVTAIDVRRAELAGLVEALRTSIGRQHADAFTNGRKLYDALLRRLPVKEGEALIIVPHDVLHYAPFQAFHDGAKFVVQRSMVSYAPSASAMVALLQKNGRPTGKLLGVANPDLGVQYALPAAQRELESIKALFPDNEVYFQKEATKRRVLASAAAAKVIHIAAHAEVDALDPLYSRIHLAPEGAQTGSLEAHEVYAMDLRSSHIVALSACETGLGKVTRGDEIWGFTRSFLSAGSSALLVSLWAVADGSTERLMTGFYRDLAANGARLALRNAQLALIEDKDYAHPFFWAPFNLVGNWR
jgi:CHAT domain-containing protein